MQLPPADVYVCTGDMLPNFPITPKKRDFSFGVVDWRKIDPDHEYVNQNAWAKRQGSYRQFFGSPDAPVVCVRGNHCFIGLAPMFSGGEVWEVSHLPHRTKEYCGLKFGGVRGINYICGEWSDELGGAEWSKAVDELPMDVDVLVSHAPPRGILDSLPWGKVHLGSDALASYVNRRMMESFPLRAHLFGHIHECCVTEQVGDTLFSNAATTFHELDI